MQLPYDRADVYLQGIGRPAFAPESCHGMLDQRVLEARYFLAERPQPRRRNVGQQGAYRLIRRSESLQAGADRAIAIGSGQDGELLDRVCQFPDVSGKLVAFEKSPVIVADLDSSSGPY